MKNEEEARLFALEAHKGQTYGDYPYNIHLSAVYNNVGWVNDPFLRRDFLASVAWLHDVLEDTDTTADELEERFGSFVTRSVQMITDPSDATNRRQRKAIVNNRLQLMGVDDITERAALIVKAADRLSNITHSNLSKDEDKLKMYRDEYEQFERAARREGLCNHLWNQMKSYLGLLHPNNT